MIRIHCTQKLFAKLSLDDHGRLPTKNRSELQPDSLISETNNPLSGWQGNLITLQRRNCILLVHEATRFPLLLPCLTKPDYRNLQWLFEDALMNTLLKMDASEAQMDTASNLLQPLVLDSSSNRSVLGTLNQMKGRLESLLWVDNADIQDLNPYRTAIWLAEAPCGVKGSTKTIWPKEALFDLLDSAKTGQDFNTGESEPDLAVEEKALPDNVISMAAFRRVR